MSRVTEITKKQAIPRIVERIAYDLPAPDLEHLFKVTGKILVTSLIGEITEIPKAAMIETITIAGISGTATIIVDGVTRTLTFSGSISASIDTFITDNAAAYLAAGTILTKGGAAVMVFTAEVPGVAFTGSTSAANASGDLAGTVVHTQANAINVKLIANPTVGADVDMCADLDIMSAAVGGTLTLTGTLANAMVLTAGGAGLQGLATRQVVHEGFIDLNTVVTPTQGKVSWTLQYIPIDPTATVEAVHYEWWETP